MNATTLSDVPSLAGDTPLPSDKPLVFDVSLVKILLGAKGAARPTDQARLIGLNVTHWFDLLAGRKTPSLPVAMRIARTAGTTVEKLWSEA